MSSPLKVVELFQLNNFNIKEQDVDFNNCTLESDKFVCVLSKNNETKTVNIFSLEKKNSIFRFSIAADSALMHPDFQIIALRTENILQLFNIETKSKLKEYCSQEKVLFWHWISTNTLAIVTQTVVYHWDIQNNSEPTKMFDRHQQLNMCSIINYTADVDEKWLVLIGIASGSSSSGQKRVIGLIQLYSVDKACSQIFEGHACTFINFKSESNSYPNVVLCFSVHNAQGAKLHLIEPQPNPNNTTAYEKKNVPLIIDSEFPSDIPISMQASDTFGVIYVITKFGFIHVFDAESGTCILTQRISSDPIFCTTYNRSSKGIIGITRHKGKILSISIDETSIVSFLQKESCNQKLALRFALRNNLIGADDVFIKRFNDLFASGQYQEAAQIATQAPRGILRTLETIKKFQQCSVQPGQTSPLLQYFGLLLDKGHLNKVESLELIRPVLQSGRQNLIEKWLKEEKLECSEELGDQIKQYYPTLALSVYLRAECHSKALECFAESGQFQKILLYCQKVNFNPNYLQLFRKIMMKDPSKGSEFPSFLLKENKLIDNVEAFVDVFVEFNDLRGCTAFLLEALKEDKDEDSEMQTKLLEMNLLSAPQVADAILGNKMFTKYNKNHIAQMCERSGLFQRALELYTNIYDIKRAIVHTHLLEEEWLLDYIGQLDIKSCLECLKTLISSNLKNNLEICVKISKKYYEYIGIHPLIELFESFKAYDGLYLFLGSIFDFIEDAEVHFKYIESSVRIGQFKELERICLKSTFYDPEKVKNFLKEAKLKDQLPLIIVCDRFGFVHELVLYLYRNDLMNFIEIYIQKVNPKRLPVVVGGLLDVGCSEDIIKKLIILSQSNFDLAELTDEVEKRNKMKILLSWLELQLNQGSQESSVHTALAKIYVDCNQNSERFLTENNYYDPVIVGKYCSQRNPNLAIIAFKKGLCDNEMIQLCHENALFKNEARYLVNRKNIELWSKALDPINEFRRQIVDQVVQTALPETQDSEEVAIAVKAFIIADLPNELIELLEKIVLDPNSLFNGNRSLQNLLLLTAIKANPNRVVDLINRCENYDAPEIAQETLKIGLFEESYLIYKKFSLNEMAIRVLVQHTDQLSRAISFAEECNEAKVYSILAKAQLDKLFLKEAIDSYIKADDYSNHEEVIQVSNKLREYIDIIPYLRIANQKLRKSYIESELLYALAKCDKINDLENLLSDSSSVANIHNVADRCFNEKLFHAAKVLFNNISNFSMLSATLIQLGDLQGAVDNARKANNIKTWREICYACIDSGDLRLAKICGQYVVVHMDELENLIWHYNKKGLFNELILLLEGCLLAERVHMGLFTELSILYCYHNPNQLMDHLKLYFSRINVPKVIREVKNAHLWKELLFLYVSSSEWDNAVLCVMMHPTETWNHNEFKDIINKIGNLEIQFKALQFYYDCYPLLLSDLLTSLQNKIDPSRVVNFFQKKNSLYLIRTYLFSIQEFNSEVVNDVINALHISECNFSQLRKSIESFDNFDATNLAIKLETHDYSEFRRLSALLYKRAKKWEKAINICTSNAMFFDAIEYTSESQTPEIAEKLLLFFLENKNFVCYSACLYRCYSFIKPDVIMELTWRYGSFDFSMPYFIQVMNDLIKKMDNLALKQTEIEEIQSRITQPLLNTNSDQLMITQGLSMNYDVPVKKNYF